jgi:hypothetical protein
MPVAGIGGDLDHVALLQAPWGLATFLIVANPAGTEKDLALGVGMPIVSGPRLKFHVVNGSIVDSAGIGDE